MERRTSPEDKPQSPPLGFSSSNEHPSVSSRGRDRSEYELERTSKGRSALRMRTPEVNVSSHEDVSSGHSPFLRALMDAEAAAISAAVQLASFKDALENEMPDSRQPGTDKRRLKRQRGLLMEKLEGFRQTNKSVRQKLKILLEAEADRTDVSQQIDILLKKVTEAESENQKLKSDLNAAERSMEELMDVRRKEQENIKTAVNVSKCVEENRAHLQEQLQNKEAENECLIGQLKTLERTLTEQKLEIDDLKSSISSSTERAAQDQESLKKATRAHKQRAERFEAAIEKCYEQLREKDALMNNARLELDSWLQQNRRLTEERDKLLTRVELLKSQITDLIRKLQQEKDEQAVANAAVVQRVDRISSENGTLLVNNAALKASVAQLEQQLADCESALVEEKTLSQERKHQTEQSQCQVADLQAELSNLRIKYAKVLRETQKMSDGRNTEVEKMESQNKLLTSSVEMKESIHEANICLQEKVNSAKRQVDKLVQENMELMRRLTAQEEALSYSNRQLQQQSAESQALGRQLEAALSDVAQQVKKVKDQALSKEDSLQTKISELEAEKSRKDNELRLLRQSKQTAEKRFEVRLKDLQLSLEQSENHKQSIQNYVNFLKNSYTTMFDEGVQSSTFRSSYFLK
ncbi:outer dense fiber protein 2-like isoform X2 [Cynoglossus semilaevis]|uniref:outer dense fiber protein 2-like isoform X2 n=1 Tax=Cynoglossus semilaevis TaxID=244447 RepID=UPI000D624498|nr:outer dense fiber protein 2-like isoform X2 [Cynoglossus semilaevis]